MGEFSKMNGIISAIRSSKGIRVIRRRLGNPFGALGKKRKPHRSRLDDEITMLLGDDLFDPECESDKAPSDVSETNCQPKEAVSKESRDNSAMRIETVPSDAFLDSFDPFRKMEMRRQAANEAVGTVKLSLDDNLTAADAKPFEFNGYTCSFREIKPSMIMNYSKSKVLTAYFKYPAVYYRKVTDPMEYPCTLLCAADDETIRLMGDNLTAEKIAENLHVFSQMSSAQQQYVLAYASQRKASQKTANAFVPITDKDQLQLTYELVKDNLSEEVRVKCQLLFDKIDGQSLGSDKEDALTQLSFMLSIDTYGHPARRRSFEEMLAILDEHLYGMNELKQEIAEYMMTLQYSGASGCAFLLVGPPGVGKTSIVEAIATCLDKPMSYIDCAGVGSVSMNGLVKSYSGAKPGKPMDAFRLCGRADIVMLFDEIDKLASDKDGDPNSVFIKALGPQKALYDEFVGANIDVSKTVFACTANDLSKIPEYVLNRFGNNIFFINPYTIDEKIEIALDYIIPKKCNTLNVSEEDIHFTEGALRTIAEEYTTDGGVREMGGYIESIFRKVITGWMRGSLSKPTTVDREFVLAHIKRHSIESYQIRIHEMSCKSRRIGF